MNMLKLEDNAKYRQTIKNVLEFNPEILKRFVNFMNNPDELTAIEQFGREGKYIGAAVLLVTMPGLPMFGHGQVEGFHEKYGMEYRRAMWDEAIDEHLVAAHESRVFPLMRKRYLFSGSENFALYDFVVGDAVNEDVFAYSNRCGGERGLVVYHNRYAATAGWINTSSAMARRTAEGESALVQTSLGEALGFDPAPGCYYAFRDLSSGREYLRSGQELVASGLYVELGAYDYKAFLDFRELRDDAAGTLAKLHVRLGGSSVENVDEECRVVRFEAAHMAMRALLESCQKAVVVQADAVQVDAVQVDVVQADAVRAEAVQADAVQADAVQADAVQADAVRADAVAVESSARRQAIFAILDCGEALMAALVPVSVAVETDVASDPLAASVVTKGGKPFGASDHPGVLASRVDLVDPAEALARILQLPQAGTSDDRRILLLVWLVLARPLSSSQPKAAELAARLDQTGLSRVLDRAGLHGQGLPASLIVKVLLGNADLFLSVDGPSLARAFSRLFMDSAGRQATGLHHSGGIEWFRKEGFEEVVRYLWQAARANAETPFLFSDQVLCERMAQLASGAGYRSSDFLAAVREA
jgi:hypothetical protein